jgi:phospholipid/cholesterol/gamma-HCH transport system substrate-binding protein
MKKNTPFRIVAAIAAATAIVAASCTACSTGSATGPNVVTAVFNDASPLLPGFTVRSHGVKIGEIDNISVHGGQAWVRMNIDEADAWPLHVDATAKIRPVSLLGERYVDFSRGSAGSPVAVAGAPIPVERTSSAVDLSDVLNTVDQPTGTALAALLTTAGDGVHARGRDIDRAISELAPSLQGTDSLVTMLNQQNDVLASLIDRAAPVAQALDGNEGQDLDHLLSSTELLLRTTTESQAAIDGTLKRLPQTLGDARATLARLAGVSEQGTSTLSGLRPFTDALPRMTGEIQDFSDAADPALAGLDPVLKHGQELINEAAPLVRALRPAGPDLRSVSDSTRPIVAELTDNLGGVLAFFRNWSMVCNAYDGLSNYFRGLAVATPTMGTGLLPGVIARAVPPLPGPLDKNSLRPPKLPLMGANDSGDTDPGNATGLTQDQERDMFHGLLGGG